MDFHAILEQSPLRAQARRLTEICEKSLAPGSHGDLPRWYAALDDLPRLKPARIDLHGAAIRAVSSPDQDQLGRMEAALQALKPWRKGPYELHGIHIDSEWRSNLKWDRLSSAVQLQGKQVLDVGCGNGYYGWRMLGAGAAAVLGIDPTPLYVMQHRAVDQLLGGTANHVLPLGIDDLEPDPVFDTVFSMGVLYHRRSPIDHLQQLQGLLRPGGELVLETLVIEGDEQSLLFPPDRYARMRNVWFIPSVALLERWLQRTGYRKLHLVDLSPTTPTEQRRTAWMPFHSLAQFLDPDEPSRTIEGHPAPLRAVLVATKPD